MKLVPLSCTGKLAGRYSAMVDDEDYDFVMGFAWTACRGRNGSVYAYRNSPVDGNVKMHRVIYERANGKLPVGMFVDHKEPGQILGLDNRRSNLRAATNSQNQANGRAKCTNKTGFKGVHWRHDKQCFHAVIRRGGRPKHLGYFQSASAAGEAYDRAARDMFGAFARTNSAEPMACR